MPASQDPSPTKSQQQHASARLPSSPTARLKEADPTWQAKLCLRALAAVLSLASASCFCTALFIWPERATSERFRRRYLIDMPTDDLPLFPLFWSVISTIPFTAYLLARKRPLHPALVIASDLAVLVTLGGLSFWVVVGSAFRDYSGAYPAVRCVKSSDVDPSCYSAWTKGLCELAGLSLMAGSLVAHFALFVWLCMETDVRRKRETRMRLEALLLRCDGPDEQGEMATDSGVDVGGMSRVRTKRAERMAAEELSW